MMTQTNQCTKKTGRINERQRGQENINMETSCGHPEIHKTNMKRTHDKKDNHRKQGHNITTPKNKLNNTTKHDTQYKHM